MANINKESILTQEYVKEIFHYSEGFLYWKAHKKILKNGTKSSKIFKTNKGVLRRSIFFKSNSFYESRLIFFYHYGYFPEIVDHKDLDTLNNKIENLRAADKFKNAHNRGSNKNVSSKYKGVYSTVQKTYRFVKESSERKVYMYYRWSAQISYDNKQIHIGQFKTENEAALAYNKAAVKYHKEFANLNIITL